MICPLKAAEIFLIFVAKPIPVADTIIIIIPIGNGRNRTFIIGADILTFIVFSSYKSLAIKYSKFNLINVWFDPKYS
jgi:hypothetical protein